MDNRQIFDMLSNLEEENVTNNYESESDSDSENDPNYKPITKEDDNIIKDKCKDYDGSLKIKQDMIFATFCIEFLEKRKEGAIED